MAKPNGNGKRKVKFDGATDEKGRIIVDDLVSSSVLLMYFVQKLGQASNAQIAEKVEAAGVTINSNLLDQALEALRSRDYVSIATGNTNDGEVVSQYKPRKACFAGMPEVAQVTKAFLSNLVSTPDAEGIVAAMNDDEVEGNGTAKAKESKIKYRDYWFAEAVFETTNEMLGGRPASEFSDNLMKMGPPCPKECDLRFPRDAQGWPTVPMSNIKGWLGNCLRLFNHSPAVLNYIAISGGKIEFDPKMQIRQVALPIVQIGSGSHGGLGMSTYEVLPAGATIMFRFGVPAHGVGSPEEFRNYLETYASMPIRGFSNARSSCYGHAKLVNWKVMGIAVKAAKKTSAEVEADA
jgi:hypothetical protein